jgi:predicted nucleic acid-binding protein
MGEEYLIDTNIVIDYLDNKIHKDGMNFMNNLIDAVPNISVITKIELLRFNASLIIYKTLTDFTYCGFCYFRSE